MQNVNEMLIKMIWNHVEELSKFLFKSIDRSYLLADAFSLVQLLENKYIGNTRKVTSFYVYVLQTFSILASASANETNCAPLASLGTLVYLAKLLKVIYLLTSAYFYIPEVNTFVIIYQRSYRIGLFLDKL